MRPDRSRMSKKGGGKDGDEGDERSPWLVGVVGVHGVVPPGRRLAPASERRESPWSASGVRGVRPPGRQKPGEGPASEPKAGAKRKQALREKAATRLLAEAKQKRTREAPARPGAPRAQKKAIDPGRPVVGFEPHPFDDQRDPPTLKEYLDAIAQFFAEHPPGPTTAESLAELIVQSRAPFEITVAFTILSAVVGRDTTLRRRFMLQLERGAKTFFNLSMRLDRTVKPPRGLSPHTMDPIFYDLPGIAYQIPYAFLTYALCRMLELLRGESEHDRALVDLAENLHRQHIARRSFGDKPLQSLFPFETPEWAPERDNPEEDGSGDDDEIPR